MLKVKYLYTLALVAMFAVFASGMACAQWVSLDYTDGLTATDTAAMLVPTPGPDMAEETFPDVPLDFWAWAQVEECSNAATASSEFIVQGYGDGSYQPEQVVTRGQMAVFIARAAGYTDEAPETPSFFDVNTDYWAFTEIEQCVLNGVVQGYADYFGTGVDGYLPANSVDRAQMAVYIQRAAELATVAYTGAFDDVDDTFWAADSIQACVDAQIVAGYPDYFGDGLDAYLPDNNVTRAQMAVFIWRALVRDAGCVVLGGPAATADDSWLPGAVTEGSAELFLPDVVTATGAEEVDVAPGTVVYIALDAVQCPDGDIVFEVSHVETNDNGTPDDDSDDFDETIVDDDGTVTVDAAAAEALVSGSACYLVASYQIESGLTAEDYTVTVELPNGAVLTIGEFTVE